MTVSQIIHALGGPVAVGEKLGISEYAVKNWRARGSIPSRYHHALLLMAAGHITADQIVAAHADRPMRVSGGAA